MYEWFYVVLTEAQFPLKKILFRMLGDCRKGSALVSFGVPSLVLMDRTRCPFFLGDSVYYLLWWLNHTPLLSSSLPSPC